MVVLCALLLPMAMIGCSPASEPTPTPTQAGPIVFGDISWDSAQVHNRIAAFILENGYGYEPDYIPGDTAPLWMGLEKGDVDVIMESWTENILEIYNKAIDSGAAVDLGSNYPDSGQGWLVPTYMIKGDAERGIEATAPDLKTVFDLPQYWELFKDPEVPTKGRFFNSIPGWQCTEINSIKLKTYGLDESFNDFLTGSGAALSGSMVSAYEKGEPWVGYYWEPTWILGKLDMTYLEEPPFDQSEWDNKTYGCAYSPVQVNIIVNTDFADSNPQVVEFLSNYETTTAMVNQVLSYMQENEASTNEAAIWFLQENEDLWTKWVSPEVAAKVKAALP
ncbi:MAG: ABC transporter substrate-binding protein [Dehalococcoidia bacterium]|nr:ABC transporter substrate-binding protein [Dehalococcoidia bacterium]